jgi:phosphatidylserine decarboxylase
MIKFGSRTDVLIPANLVEKVLVKVGTAVYGGSTIILKLKD